MNDPHSHRRPNAGVTVVPFIYQDGVLKTLVYKRPESSEVFGGLYSLPNRFFDITEFEELNQAAYRALEEKTNIKIPHMTQFYTFSGSYIDPTRVTTVNTCFYSILKEKEVEEVVSENHFETEWINVEDARKLKLAFNHNEVLDAAYDCLIKSAEYTVNPVHFFEDGFTINDLKGLTEILLGHPLDSSRYRDRIKKSGILIEVEGKIKTGRNRPSQLYKYNTEFEGYFYPKSLTKAT